MKYAVVETAKQFLITSEKWLDEDEKICKYPRSLDGLKNVVNDHKEPEDDWKNLTVVQIHGKFGNYFNMFYIDFISLLCIYYVH